MNARVGGSCREGMAWYSFKTTLVAESEIWGFSHAIFLLEKKVMIATLLEFPLNKPQLPEKIRCH